MDDQVLALPRAQAGDAARRARRQGDRHAGHAGAVRRRDAAPRPGVHAASRALLTVTPPSWRFDLQIEEDLIEEVIRVLGYAQLPDTPPLRAGDGARAQRGAAQPARAAPRAGRARLPGDDQLQLRRGALGARARRQRRPDPRAEPDRQPAGGDALAACSAAWSSVLRSTSARKATRVRVFEVGRVFRRDAAVRRRRRAAWPASRQPMRLGRPGLRRRPTRCSGARRSVPSTSSTSRATSKRCSRRGAARFVAGRAPGAAPGALRPRSSSTARAIGHRRRTAPALAPGLRAAGARRCCSNSTPRPCCSATLPAFAPLPRQQSVWRDLAVVVGEAVTHDALMRRSPAPPQAGLVRSARLFDIYKPATPGGRHRRRRAQPGGAAGTARRRGHADRRAHRRGGRRCARRAAASALGVRLRG